MIKHLLLLAALAVIAGCFLEGAAAAGSSSRQLTQYLKYFKGPNPNHAVLYSEYQFQGKALRLRVGSQTLSTTWRRIAKSLWLPDGYAATIWYGPTNNDQYHVQTYRTSFTNTVGSQGLPQNIEGKILRIQIHKQGGWAQITAKLINDERTRAKLGFIALNPKLSERAYKICQEDAQTVCRTVCVV